MTSESMEKIYSVGKWIDEPGTEEGSKRYQQTLTEMRRLIGHDWLKEALVRSGSIRILDVCGGWGIAGVALSKILREQGKDTELTVLDLRRDMEKSAKAFGAGEIGAEPEFILADATRLGELGKKFDVVLLWGMSTSHFSPWDMTRFLAGVSLNLEDHGLLLVEEADRIYTVFIQSGYQRVFSEGASEEKAVISLHSSYDPRRGMFKRLIIDLLEGGKAADEFHFWGLADAAQAIWVFFKDVDFIPRDRYRGVLIAKEPRRGVDLKVFLDSEPAMLKK